MRSTLEDIVKSSLTETGDIATVLVAETEDIIKSLLTETEVQ